MNETCFGTEMHSNYIKNEIMKANLEINDELDRSDSRYLLLYILSKKENIIGFLLKLITETNVHFDADN